MERTLLAASELLDARSVYIVEQFTILVAPDAKHLYAKTFRNNVWTKLKWS